MRKNKEDYYTKQAVHLIKDMEKEIRREFVQDGDEVRSLSGANSIYYEITYKGKPLKNVKKIIIGSEQ